MSSSKLPMSGGSFSRQGRTTNRFSRVFRSTLRSKEAPKRIPSKLLSGGLPLKRIWPSKRLDLYAAFFKYDIDESNRDNIEGKFSG
jgi:hypothetical protein